MTIISRLTVICTFLIFKAGLLSLYAQSGDFINGKVLNSGTLRPVPFATIKLKNNQLGVYANADGDFRISRNVEFNDDSLMITCIGFKQTSVAYKDLSEITTNTIFLEPVVYGLREVKIVAAKRNMSSLAIIRRAIRNIKKNYPQQPFNYISYYRDYQKKDSTYLNMNEAIVQSFDLGFNIFSGFSTYRLLDFRQNNEFSRLAISPYYDYLGSREVNNPDKRIPKAIMGDQYGNELLVLMVHDALRNYNQRSFSYVETFESDFLLNHVFSKPVEVLNNNLPLYKIDFTAKRNLTRDSLAVSGSIYIQPRDYSIHKLEYTAYYKTSKKTLKPIYNIDIEYGYENSVDSRMCLKYISFNNIFKVIDPNDENYFRVTGSAWDTLHKSKTTIGVEFNKDIDRKSASKKENYNITIGKRTAKISSIQVTGKKIYIRLKDEDILGKADPCRIIIKDVKDTKGEIMDQRRSIELYQYRELFVQDYNKTLPFTDSCLMRYLPLDKNCISRYSGNFNYWMNTPVNTKPK
jgi:hypothetical protein